jgi:AcrR family transcriptional regulator
MPRWTASDLQQMLAELHGALDDDSDPKVKKRRRILASATKLFIEQGYRKTSVDEIARDAHIAKGTIYLYFPNKAYLLAGAIALEKQAFVSHVIPLLDESRPARDRLKEWIRITLVVSQEMPLVSRLMGGDPEVVYALQDLAKDAPDLMAQSDDLRMKFVGHLLEDTHGGGWSEDELDERTKVVTGFLYIAGLISKPEIRQGLSLERFAELLAEMMVDGIASPAERSA